MDDKQENDFGKTAMWQKSIAAEAKRNDYWFAKLSVPLLSLGAAAVVLILLYLVFR